MNLRSGLLANPKIKSLADNSANTVTAKDICGRYKDTDRPAAARDKVVPVEQD